MSQEKPIYLPAHRLPLVIAVGIGLLLWLIPPPADLTPKAWHLLAIFAMMIVGIVGKALSMGGMSLLGLTILTTTQTLSIKEALSGFSHPVVWLVVCAFLLARSFIKTGLGARLAYLFIAWLGKKTLGLGYGIAITEVALAPVIPSNTARAGGIIYPIVQALAVNFGSTPARHSQRLIGSFLILVAYYCNLITSAMFLTGMAANPIMVSFIAEKGETISWGTWALAASLPGIISLIVIPYLVYLLYPPEIKETPEAGTLARQKLSEMGPMTLQEWITLTVFILLALLWMIGESLFHLDSTTVAFIGISILMVTGVLTWNDIKKEHEAWDTLVWFSVLITIASFLNQMGVIHAFTQVIHDRIAGVGWHIAFPILILLYFYSHYAFASNTAHITSMFPAFLSIGLALGTPLFLMGFSLAVTSNLFACITHYGTGCAPILFGSEYVNLKTWWKMGALVSVIFIIIWIGFGAVWWKFLGLW